MNIGLPKAFARLAANSVWLSLERFGTATLSLIVAAMVARYLGPADFGKLAYAFSIAAMFAVLGHLGMEGIIVRELKSDPQKITETLGTVFGLKLVAYSIAALCLLLFAFLTPGHDREDQYIFLFSSIFIAASALNFISSWFLSRLEGRTIALTHLAGTITSLCFKVALIFAGASVIWFGAANMLSIFVAAALMFIAFKRQDGPAISKWSFSSERARKLLSEGGIVFVGSIFAIIYLKIDLVMLRWLSEERVVGEYAVAAQISEAAYIIPSAIVASVFPRLIEIKETRPVDYEWRFQQVFDTLFLASLGVVAGVYLFGGWLLGHLFGSAYSASSTILLVHILAAPFIFMRYAFSRWILIEHVAIYSVLTQGAGAFLNVFLNLILIPQMGGIGAAIATVVSYVTASYLSLAIWSRTRPIFIKMSRSLFRPISAVQRVLHSRSNTNGQA